MGQLENTVEGYGYGMLEKVGSRIDTLIKIALLTLSAFTLFFSVDFVDSAPWR